MSRHPHVHDEHHQHARAADDPSGEPHTHRHRHERQRHLTRMSRRCITPTGTDHRPIAAIQFGNRSRRLLRCTSLLLAHSRMLAKAPGQVRTWGLTGSKPAPPGETLSPSALDPKRKRTGLNGSAAHAGSRHRIEALHRAVGIDLVKGFPEASILHPIESNIS